MKTDRKVKAEKSPPKIKVVKGSQGVAPKTNGKQPLAAYEHIPIGIVESSLEGKYIEANAEFCRILGYSKKEVLQFGIKDCTHEDDYSIDIKLHERLVAGKIPFYRLEKRFVRKDGSSIWVELTRTIIRDAEAKPLYTMGVVLDISERKDVERVLRDSVERLRLATEAAQMFMWEWDFQNRVYTLADNFTQVIGFSADLLPKNSLETLQGLIPAEDVRAIAEAFERAIENRGDPPSLPCRVLNPENGQTVWLEVSTKIVYGLTGNPERMFGVAQNITERKRNEYSLVESARRQEALYQLADQLHRTHSLEDIFNAALDAILGALQCDRASILLSDNTGVMRFVAWRGLSEGYRKATDGHSPWKPDAKNPEPICIHAIDTAELSDSLKAVIKGEGIGSLAFIPLVSNGKLVGKFMAYFNTPHVFSEDELELSLTISRQLAFGVDRKRAEEKLRASEALYRTIARSIPGGGVYVVDKEFRYIVAEGPVTEAFGLSRERLEGHTVSEALPEEQSASMMERLQRNFAGETINYETKYNGHVYWTQQAPLLDSIGQAIIVSLDITERKRAEEALRQSEERFAQFMQHLPALAWIKDIQGRYVYANAAAEKAFSTPREKLYGKTDAEIFPAEAAVQFKKNDELALRDEKGVQSIEMLQHDDDVLHYSLVSKFPIPGPDGNTALIGGTAFDISERLRAEEALQESEERLQAILSQATAGIVRKDAEGRFIFVNQAFCNMLGYTESELLGKTFWQFTYHEDVEENKRLYDRMMIEGAPFKLEKRLIRRNGSVLWVDVSVSPIMDSTGKPQSAVAVELDISGRKLAEEALRGNEKMFSTLVDAAPFGVYFIDSDFRLRAINKGSEAVFGGIHPLIGRDFAEILHLIWQEPFATEAIERFYHTLRTGESFISPPVIEKRANIEEIQAYDWQIHRITLADGTFGVVCYFYDLSEQKRMEAAVRASEERYHNLFDLVPVAVYSCDADGLIQEYNHTAVELWGREPERNNPKEKYCGSFRIFHPDGRFMPHEESPMSRTLHGETLEPHELEILIERPDGVRRSVIAHPLPLKNERGEIYEAINCLYDITERKQAEDDLQQLNLQLESRVQKRTATIQAINQSLRDEITERKRVEQALQESHGRLRVLSQRLVEVQEDERRALARELHDRVGQTLAALNINLIIINGQLSADAAQQIGMRLNDSMKLVAETIALVRDVMTDLRPAVLDDYGLEAALEAHLNVFKSRYGIEVTLEKPEQPIVRLGPSVEMTFLRIAQEALMNIARHAHANQVQLSLRQEETTICLTVQDNGIGIESREDANRPGSHGLTIMRERAEAFDGNLRVKSVPGQGTKIEISIPFKYNEQNKVQEKSSL